MKRTIIMLICPILVLSFSSARGQKKLFEPALSAVNQLFKGSCEFEVKGGQLVVNMFEGDRKYRKDKIYFEDIDTNTLKYDSEKEQIIIKCKDILPGCVTRNLYIQGIKRSYSRLSIPVKDEESNQIDDKLVKVRELLDVITKNEN